MISHIIASSHPPPRAYPDTAAMTGVRIVFARWDQGAMKLFEYADAKVRDAISLISAPAINSSVSAEGSKYTGKKCDELPAKAFSLPVMIMAPISLSSSYLVRASFSSRKSGLDRALRAFGLLRVTIWEVHRSDRVSRCRNSTTPQQNKLLQLQLHMCLGKFDYILRPTPGFGVEVRICS